jgi:hypothetical protein
MREQREAGSKAWAEARVKAWNWNCNPAEIAKELIDEGIKSGSPELQRVRRAFLDFFPHERAVRWWEFIEQAVGVFGE